MILFKKFKALFRCGGECRDGRVRDSHGLVTVQFSYDQYNCQLGGMFAKTCKDDCSKCEYNKLFHVVESKDIYTDELLRLRINNTVIFDRTKKWEGDEE